MGTVELIVDQIVPAVTTCFGVRGMGNLTEVIKRVGVVEPEGDPTRRDVVADRGQRWIVDVDYNGRRWWEMVQRGTPMCGNRVQLTVPIELISEEIIQDD